MSRYPKEKKRKSGTPKSSRFLGLDCWSKAQAGNAAEAQAARGLSD